MESTAIVTAAMLKPLVDTISTNVGVLLPVGIGIMGIMIGIAIIPRIIYKFF